MLFGESEDEVRTSILTYLSELESSLDRLEGILDRFLGEGHADPEELRELVELNRGAESVRRRVQVRVYEEGFLPVLREDYVRFTRELAGVSRTVGTIGELIVYQQPPVPPSLHGDVRELVEVTRGCFESVTGSIEPLGEDKQAVNEALERLAGQHREVDTLKRRLIRDVFRNEEPSLAEKLLVRHLPQGLASTADSMRRACEHVELLQVKRSL